MRAPREKDFAIATHLLRDAPPTLAWANLGDWSAATQYDEACRDLARRVGAAAALAADDRVLDLACGHGASLAFWPEAFGVRRVTGLEFQSRCVARIRQAPPPGLEAIEQGRFDVLPPPAALRAGAFDAAVCVDAAYHADSLAAFAAFTAQLLRPGGRLAFTTLVTPDGAGAGLRLVLAPARIPAASVVDEDTLIATLEHEGFAAITVQYLDEAVLGGFAGFVERRGRELPWSRRAGAEWLKIRATAWLCRQARQRGALRYALISARRNLLAAG